MRIETVEEKIQPVVSRNKGAQHIAAIPRQTERIAHQGACMPAASCLTARGHSGYVAHSHLPPVKPQHIGLHKKRADHFVVLFHRQRVGITVDAVEIHIEIFGRVLVSLAP